MNTSAEQDTVTARKVGEVLWRRKITWLVVALIVFLVGSAVVVTRPKVYQAQASVALLPAATNQATLPNYPALITSLVPTYVQLVSSPVLLNRVAAKLPFATTGTALANDVHAESLSNAAVINIVAQSASPVQAKQIASEATVVFLSKLKGNKVVIPHVYAKATVPTAPAGPRKKLLLAVVLLLAILLGLAAALIKDRFSAVPQRTAEPRPAPQVDHQADEPERAGTPRPRQEVHQSRSDQTDHGTVRLMEATTRSAGQSHAVGDGYQAQENEPERQQ